MNSSVVRREQVDWCVPEEEKQGMRRCPETPVEQHSRAGQGISSLSIVIDVGTRLDSQHIGHETPVKVHQVDQRRIIRSCSAEKPLLKATRDDVSWISSGHWQ